MNSGGKENLSKENNENLGPPVESSYFSQFCEILGLRE